MRRQKTCSQYLNGKHVKYTYIYSFSRTKTISYWMLVLSLSLLDYLILFLHVAIRLQIFSFSFTTYITAQLIQKTFLPIFLGPFVCDHCNYNLSNHIKCNKMRNCHNYLFLPFFCHFFSFIFIYFCIFTIIAFKLVDFFKHLQLMLRKKKKSGTFYFNRFTFQQL